MLDGWISSGRTGRADTAGFDLGPDVPVGEQHAGNLPVPVRRRRGQRFRTFSGRCAASPAGHGPLRGCSSMAERQLPKLIVRVRFSSPAPQSRPGQGRFPSLALITLTLSVDLPGHYRAISPPGRARPPAPSSSSSLRLLGLDVGVDRAGDRLVRAARLVLVDHGRALAVVAHPRHQVPQARAAGRRERVARMPQIMKMQALGADRPHRVRPGRHLVEVAPPQRAAHRPRERPALPARP